MAQASEVLIKVHSINAIWLHEAELLWNYIIFGQNSFEWDLGVCYLPLFMLLPNMITPVDMPGPLQKPSVWLTF